MLYDVPGRKRCDLTAGGSDQLGDGFYPCVQSFENAFRNCCDSAASLADLDRAPRLTVVAFWVFVFDAIVLSRITIITFCDSCPLGGGPERSRDRLWRRSHDLQHCL